MKIEKVEVQPPSQPLDEFDDLAAKLRTLKPGETVRVRELSAPWSAEHIAEELKRRGVICTVALGDNFRSPESWLVTRC